MQTILLLVHVLAAVGMVGLILMQHGKGADAEPHLVVVPQPLFLALRGQALLLPA